MFIAFDCEVKYKNMVLIAFVAFIFHKSIQVLQNPKKYMQRYLCLLYNTQYDYI